MESLFDVFRSRATFRGNHPNGSPEWHELRNVGVGGSDVAALCGVSPWQSAYTWAAKRLSLIPDDFTQSEAMEWGSRLESVILDKFQDNHPELEVITDLGSFSHPDRAWQLANPDGAYRDADGRLGIIEVKTARFEDDWKDGVPAYYQTQVQWYLQVFGLNHAYIVVLFQGSKYREFEIAASAFEQDVNLAQVQSVWSQVEAGQLPEFSAPMASTLDTVRRQHPNIDPNGEVELGDLGVFYHNALDDAEKANSHLDEMRARVLEAMGDAKHGLIFDQRMVQRQARNGGTPYLVNKR